MWLEAMLLPDALHGCVADTDLLGQHPRAPVRCVPGFLLGCPRHDREPHFGTDRLLARARPLAPVLEQALDAAVHVGFLPAPNRRLRHPSLAPDGIRAEAATRQQHNACARNDFLRRLAIGDEPLQCRAVTGPDVQARINVSHADVKSDLQALGNPINGSEHVDHSTAPSGQSATGWRGSLSGWARCVARYRRSTRQRRRTKRSTLNS